MIFCKFRCYGNNWNFHWNKKCKPGRGRWWEGSGSASVFVHVSVVLPYLAISPRDCSFVPPRLFPWTGSHHHRGWVPMLPGATHTCHFDYPPSILATTPVPHPAATYKFHACLTIFISPTRSRRRHLATPGALVATNRSKQARASQRPWTIRARIARRCATAVKCAVGALVFCHFFSWFLFGFLILMSTNFVWVCCI